MEKLAASADYLRRARRPRQKPPPCAPTGRPDPGGSGRTQRRPRHRGQPDRARQARSASLDTGTTRQGRRSLTERPAALTNGPAPFPVRSAGDRPSTWCLMLLENLQQRHDLHDRLDCQRKHLPSLVDPFMSRLLHLQYLQKRHDRIGGRDPHPSHPLPLVSSRPWVGPDLTTSGPASFPKRAAEDRPVLRRAYFPLNVCISGMAESTGMIFIFAHPLPHVGPGLVPGATGEGKDFLNAGVLVSANHAREPGRTYARAILTSLNRPDRKEWA